MPTELQKPSMKNLYVPAVCRNLFLGLIALTLACALPTRSLAAPAVTLFEDHFTGGIPGWSAVQPAGGNYIEGTLLWVFDPTFDAFSEQSNLYTDSSTAS